MRETHRVFLLAYVFLAFSYFLNQLQAYIANDFSPVLIFKSPTPLNFKIYKYYINKYTNPKYFSPKQNAILGIAYKKTFTLMI